MSTATDLRAAVEAVLTEQAATLQANVTLVQENASLVADLRDAGVTVVDLQRRLVESDTLAADLRDVNGKLTAKVAELLARIAVLEGEDPDPDPEPEPEPEPEPVGVLVGWSMSNNPHPGECGVTRIYDLVSSSDLRDLDTAVNVHKVKRICVSSRDDTKNPATVVSRIKTVLAKYPGLEVDYAHENEVDREDHRGGSDTDIRAWCSEHKAIQDAIRREFPADGSKGKVKTAIDGTSWSHREGRTVKFMDEMKRIDALPDVLAASWYPAGRKKNPPVESPIGDHIDLWFDMAAKYGIKYVSCWEIGTPVSSAYDRAALVTKWVKRGRELATAKGVVFRDFIWWDQNIGIDNRFAADGSTTTVQGRTQKALLAAAV